MADNVVKLDTREWDKFLSGLVKNVGDATATLLTLSKIHGFADIIDHFAREEGPDGRWKKRASSTQQRYARIMRGELRPPTGIARNAFNPSNKLLQLTGNLRQSLIPSRGGARKREKNTVELFTPVVYAGVHQYGYKNIPARPFMWLSEQAGEKIIRDLIASILEKS